MMAADGGFRAKFKGVTVAVAVLVLVLVLVVLVLVLVAVAVLVPVLVAVAVLVFFEVLALPSRPVTREPELSVAGGPKGIMSVLVKASVMSIVESVTAEPPGSKVTTGIPLVMVSVMSNVSNPVAEPPAYTDTMGIAPE